MIQTQDETRSNQAEQGRTRQDKRRINFSDGDRERHLQLLKSWLHPDLRNLDGVGWTERFQVPSSGISSIRLETLILHPILHLPSVQLLAPSMRTHSRQCSQNVYVLLHFIQTHCVAWDGEHLTREVWNEFITKMEKSAWRRKMIISYSSFTERHLPDYLERFDTEVSNCLAPYILPRLPIRFIEQHSRSREVYADIERRRKEKATS